MIETNEQLAIAQNAIQTLQKVLLASRKVHTPTEYRAMSEPILLELQQREQDILIYLSRTEAEIKANVKAPS